MQTERLAAAITQFLSELQGRRSPHTLRAYGADLRHLTSWLESEQCSLSPEAIQSYFVQHPSWAAATVSRKQSSLERFCHWAVRQGLLEKDPTLNLEHVRLPPAHPRGLRREQIDAL